LRGLIPGKERGKQKLIPKLDRKKIERNKREKTGQKKDTKKKMSNLQLQGRGKDGAAEV